MIKQIVMKTRKLFFAIITVLLFQSTSFAQGKLLAKEGQAIPDSFQNYKGTMLVLYHGNFQVDKCLEKTFEKYYTGNYTLIEKTDQYNKRYNDSLKYRYVFITYTNSHSGQWRSNPGGSGYVRESPSSNYSYGVLDRVTGKSHNISFFGGAYKGLMEAYVKKLEEERKKSN